MSVTTITKELVLETEAKLVEAIKISDVPTLDGLLHDDLLFIAPNGQTVTKAMDLASHKSGTMIVDKMTAVVEEVSIINNSAVTIVVINTKGKVMGQPIEGKFKYVRVWSLVNGGLKVIGGSMMEVKF